jgi:ABC-type polysaccharide/polyol phosphate export permease
VTTQPVARISSAAPFAGLDRIGHWFELVFTFASRDIQARYKQSVLGIYWAIINPLVYAALLTFIFSHVLHSQTGSVPHSLFVLSGLLGWNLFANGIGSALVSVSSFATLMAKVKFSREVLPIASVMARWVDFSVTLGAVLLHMALAGVHVTPAALWIVPLVISMTLVTVGVSLVIAATNVYFRDTAQIVQLVLNLGFLASPIVYPVEAFPTGLQFIFWINPASIILHFMRRALVYGEAPDAGPAFGLFVMSVGVALGGFAVFNRMQRRFAEIL